MDESELEAMLAGLGQAETQGPTAGLHQRVLADFDRLAARRGTSWLRNVGDWIWPGATLWQPAAALALSLVIGVLVGDLMPFDSPFDSDTQSAATAIPNDFNEALP